MAADKEQNIEFRLRVTGGDEAARAFDKTKQSMDRLGNEATDTGRKLDQAAVSLQSAGQKAKVANDNMGKSAVAANTRVSGLAAGVAGLGTVVNNTSPKMSAFAGVLGTAGGAVSGLTSAIGLPGALIGGALVAALGLLSRSTETAAEKQTRFAEKLAASKKRADDLARSLLALQVAENPELAGLLGFGAGTRAAATKAAVGQREELSLERDAVKQKLERTNPRARKARAELENELGRLNQEIQKLTNTIEKTSGISVAGEGGAVTTTARSSSTDPTQKPGFGTSSGEKKTRGKKGATLDQLMSRAAAGKGAGDPTGGIAQQIIDEDKAIQEERFAQWEANEKSIADANFKRRQEELRLAEETERKKADAAKRAAEERIAAERQVGMAAMESFNIVGTAAITATSAIIQGNSEAAKAAIAAIGDQLVASGIKDLLEAAALAIFGVTAPQAGALAGVGAAKIATGTAMGAVLRAGAGAGATSDTMSVSPVGSTNYRTLGGDMPASPLSSGGTMSLSGGGFEDSRPIVINVNKVGHVTPRDGQIIAEALDKATRRSPSLQRQYGRR